MLKNIKFNLNYMRSSFGSRIIFIFFSFAIIFTFIFTFINLNRNQSKQREELEISLNKVHDNFVDSLTHSLWNIDDAQVTSIILSILTNNDIKQVKVINHGEVLFEKGEQVSAKYLIERKYPLIKKQKGDKRDYIGDLYVGATTQNFEKRLLDEVRYNLITELIKILFFIFITFFVLKILITRHLTMITNFFYETNIYKSQKKLQLSRENEFWKAEEDDLDKLVNAINRMIDRLHQELQKRRKSEDEIKNLNENLEDMVDKKNKQLLDSNRVEAVIEMASGIAHEINSPLSIIYALAKRYKKMGVNITEEQSFDFANKIEMSTGRIFAITNALHVLSLNTLETEPQETNFREFMNSTVIGISEIFRSSLPKIDFIVDDSVPQVLLLNQSLFYQSIYSLLQLRHKDIQQTENPWIRMEFLYKNDELIWSSIDDGKSLTEEEQQMYQDPFKSSKEGQRGSNLILGTFSTLINKLNAIIVFVPHNKDIFIQLRIPFKEKK